MDATSPPTCVICGHAYAQKHRLLPGNMGGTYDPENVVRLCPNHHAMVHLRMKHREAPDSLTVAERSRLAEALEDEGLSPLWTSRVLPALDGAPVPFPELAPGTRVRLNVPTVVGGRGPGTVLECFGDGPHASVLVRLDGTRYVSEDSWTDCCRHEVSVIR